MYVGPKKFVESDFVSRMAEKHSTTTEDGDVILNPKFKIACRVFGFAVGASIAVALNVVVKRTILNDNETENPED